MCAETSPMLRFSSTMTRTLSTPAAGDAECEPAFDELGAEVGIVSGAVLVQAVTPSKKTARTMAAPRLRDRAQAFAVIFTGRRRQRHIESHRWRTLLHSFVLSACFVVAAGLESNGRGLREGCECIRAAATSMVSYCSSNSALRLRVSRHPRRPALLSPTTRWSASRSTWRSANASVGLRPA
jgi:hypothetical protein